jgi:hypothetical protein
MLIKKISKKTELEIFIKDESFKILSKITRLQLMILLFMIQLQMELKYKTRKAICFKMNQVQN